MARKEQDGRTESKSRTAQRAANAAKATPTVTSTPSPRPTKSKVRSGTLLSSCGCVHVYQDERYGPGRRVFNLGPKEGHCTVCGAKKQV